MRRIAERASEVAIQIITPAKAKKRKAKSTISQAVFRIESVVRLTVRSKTAMSTGLVVDRIPAGLEIENLNLVQQKYNVGSATVLELIDAQVQLQRAQSDGVSALAAIRVAEAQLDRVRGRAE